MGNTESNRRTLPVKGLRSRLNRAPQSLGNNADRSQGISNPVNPGLQRKGDGQNVGSDRFIGKTANESDSVGGSIDARSQSIGNGQNSSSDRLVADNAKQSLQSMGNGINSDLQSVRKGLNIASDEFLDDSARRSPRSHGNDVNTCFQSVGNGLNKSPVSRTGIGQYTRHGGGRRISPDTEPGNSAGRSEESSGIGTLWNKDPPKGSSSNQTMMEASPGASMDGNVERGPTQTADVSGSKSKPDTDIWMAMDFEACGEAVKLFSKTNTVAASGSETSPSAVVESSRTATGHATKHQTDTSNSTSSDQTIPDTALKGTQVDASLNTANVAVLTVVAAGVEVPNKFDTNLGMTKGFQASGEASRSFTKTEAVATSASDTSRAIGDSSGTALSNGTSHQSHASNLTSTIQSKPAAPATSAKMPQVDDSLIKGNAAMSTVVAPGEDWALQREKSTNAGSAQDRDQVDLCSVHPGQHVSVRCVTCRVHVCKACTATEHALHELDDVTSSEHYGQRRRALQEAEADVTRWMDQHAVLADDLVAMETAITREKEAAVKAVQEKVENVVAAVRAAGERAVVDLEGQASSLLQPLAQRRRQMEEWRRHASDVTASSKELLECGEGVQLTSVCDVVTRRLDELLATGNRLSTGPMGLTTGGHFWPELDLAGVLDGVSTSVPCYVIRRLHGNEFIPAVAGRRRAQTSSTKSKEVNPAPVTSNTNAGEKDRGSQASEAKSKSGCSDGRSATEDPAGSRPVFAAAASEESDQESSITEASSSISEHSDAESDVSLRCKTIWSKRVKEFKSDEYDCLIRCLCVDPASGQIIVGDLENERLQLYSPEGEFVRQQYLSGCPCSAALGSSTLVVVAEEKMYFYEAPCWRLKREVRIPHVVAENDAPAPTMVSALSDSTFIVGNLQGNLLLYYDSDGRLLQTTICPVQRPILSISEDHEKNLLISSWNEAAVVKVSPQGRKLKIFRRNWFANSGWYPNYAVTTRDGFVVVADYKYNDVVVFAADGNVVLKEKLPKVKNPRNLAYDRVRDRIVVSNDEGSMACLQLVHQGRSGAVSRSNAPSVTSSLLSADDSEQEPFTAISNTEASELKNFITEENIGAARRRKKDGSPSSDRESPRSDSNASESAEAPPQFKSWSDVSPETKHVGADPGIVTEPDSTQGGPASLADVTNPQQSQGKVTSSSQMVYDLQERRLYVSIPEDTLASLGLLETFLNSQGKMADALVPSSHQLKSQPDVDDTTFSPAIDSQLVDLVRPGVSVEGGESFQRNISTEATQSVSSASTVKTTAVVDENTLARVLRELKSRVKEDLLSRHSISADIHPGKQRAVAEGIPLEGKDALRKNVTSETGSHQTSDPNQEQRVAEEDARQSAQAVKGQTGACQSRNHASEKWGEITPTGQRFGPSEQQSVEETHSAIQPGSLYEASFKVEWVARVQQTGSGDRMPLIGAMAFNAYNRTIIFVDRANSAIKQYRETGSFIMLRGLEGEPPSSLCCGSSGVVAVMVSKKLCVLESRNLTQKASAAIVSCLGNSPDTAPLVARAGFSNIAVCRLQGNLFLIYDLEGKVVQVTTCPVRPPISSLASCGDNRFLLSSCGSHAVILAALEKKGLRSLRQIPLALPHSAVMDKNGFIIAIHGVDHELVVFDPRDRFILTIEIKKVVKPAFLAYNSISDVILVANESGAFASLKLKYFLKDNSKSIHGTFGKGVVAQPLVPVDMSYLLSKSKGQPSGSGIPSSDSWSLSSWNSLHSDSGASTSSAAGAMSGLSHSWPQAMSAFPRQASLGANTSSSQIKLETLWMRQIAAVGSEAKEPLICALTFNTHSREVIASDTANQALNHYDAQGDFIGLHRFYGGAPTSIACGSTTAAAVRSGKLLFLETETYTVKSIVEISGCQGMSASTAPLVTTRSDGSFALARLANNKVNYVDLNGRVTFTLQSAARAPVTSFASDPEDNLLVSSLGSGSVVLFPKGGGRVQRSVPLAQPMAAVLDRHGFLVVIDGADGNLVVFSPKDRLLLRHQLPGLPNPAFLAYDEGQDRLYVASESGAMTCLSLR